MFNDIGISQMNSGNKNINRKTVKITLMAAKLVRDSSNLKENFRKTFHYKLYSNNNVANE